MSRLLDFDPLTRTWESFAYNRHDDSVTIGYHQDIQPIIDANKERRLGPGVAKDKLQAKRDFLHYARVPIAAQYHMLINHGVRFGDPNHRRKVMALLNTAEYEYCRISHWKHDR